MTTDPSGREEDDRPQVAAPTEDDERPIFDEENDDVLPDHLDLPIETPEADALDQERIEPLDDDVE